MSKGQESGYCCFNEQTVKTRLAGVKTLRRLLVHIHAFAALWLQMFLFVEQPCRHYIYLSSLFIRMHPSMISFSSGTFTL